MLHNNSNISPDTQAAVQESNVSSTTSTKSTTSERFFKVRLEVAKNLPLTEAMVYSAIANECRKGSNVAQVTNEWLAEKVFGGHITPRHLKRVIRSLESKGYLRGTHHQYQRSEYEVLPLEGVKMSPKKVKTRGTRCHPIGGQDVTQEPKLGDKMSLNRGTRCPDTVLDSELDSKKKLDLLTSLQKPETESEKNSYSPINSELKINTFDSRSSKFFHFSPVVLKFTDERGSAPTSVTGSGTTKTAQPSSATVPAVESVPAPYRAVLERFWEHRDNLFANGADQRAAEVAYFKDLLVMASKYEFLNTPEQLSRFLHLVVLAWKNEVIGTILTKAKPMTANLGGLVRTRQFDKFAEFYRGHENRLLYLKDTWKMFPSESGRNNQVSTYPELLSLPGAYAAATASLDNWAA